MREFNITGPCDPERHFTVRRKELLQLALSKVVAGKYLTVFGPRQAGKTTHFQFLLAELAKSPDYLPIWVTAEELAETTKEKIYAVLNRDLRIELAKSGLQPTTTIADHLDLALFFRELTGAGRKIVLVIDEFDAIPEPQLRMLLHAFRSLYHNKPVHSLHSLLLVGVRNLSGVVLDHASPFNIADKIQVPYFTATEVEDLIGQYVGESGQPFEPVVIEKIFENTQGQPGLVNAMCRELVEKVCVDRTKPVNLEGFRQVLDTFLYARLDRNISNIVSKALVHRDFMLKVLFGESDIPFQIYDERGIPGRLLSRIQRSA